jgi:TolA-binding protein
MLLMGLTLTAPAQSPSAGDKQPASNVPSDIDLVKRVLDARRDYQNSLEKLRLHYVNVGDVERARWAEEELRQYHRINKQAFRLEMDVPAETLQATKNSPEANELFKQAMAYKDKGWGMDYTDNQRRAELLLQRILTYYPDSTRIGDAAYQLGDLYEGKAYRQYRRAAQYFERAVKYTPNAQPDARLRAARIYDKNQIDRNRAAELYRDVTTHDVDPKRVAEAEKRLAELGGRRQ